MTSTQFNGLLLSSIGRTLHQFDAEVKSFKPVHWSLNFLAFFLQLQKLHL